MSGKIEEIANKGEITRLWWLGNVRNWDPIVEKLREIEETLEKLENNIASEEYKNLKGKFQELKNNIFSPTPNNTQRTSENDIQRAKTLINEFLNRELNPILERSFVNIPDEELDLLSFTLELHQRLEENDLIKKFADKIKKDDFSNETIRKIIILPLIGSAIFRKLDKNKQNELKNTDELKEKIEAFEKLKGGNSEDQNSRS